MEEGFIKSLCYFDTCNVRYSLQSLEFKQAAATVRQEAQNYELEATVQYFGECTYHFLFKVRRENFKYEAIASRWLA